jgi:hypothetical protein
MKEELPSLVKEGGRANKRMDRRHLNFGADGVVGSIAEQIS